MKPFIILLFLAIFTLSSFANNPQPLTDDQLEELVESNFLRDGVPLRYCSNILIQLKGNIIKEDSLIFQELVDTLNLLIDKWDVYLIDGGTANLSFDIKNPGVKIEERTSPFQRSNGREIIETTVDLPNYLPETDFLTRKKLIRYHLLRALVVFKNKPVLTEDIPGSVFGEQKFEDITFNPVDFQIIKKLYSVEYDDKLYPKNSKKYLSTTNKYSKSLSVLGNVLAVLLSMVFLLFMFQKGNFRNHHYRFSDFLFQGILVVITVFIYLVISTLSVAFIRFSISGRMSGNPTSYVFTSIIIVFSLFVFIGFISICAIFFSERAILKRNDNFMLGILFPMFMTLFIPSLIILVIFNISIYVVTSNSVFADSLNMFLTPISFLGILSILRAFYLFLSKKSENIIRKKDLELAKMSELHKQAELQSLRSKINPHFLYNSLNSIASLASFDAQKTEQMALALSDFFKYSINREQKQLNSLSEELNAVRTYLEIEKVRFGERLSFEIDCPDELLEIPIPQLLIQPLVENAIKHGLSQITEKGMVKIVVSKTGKILNIRVYDNGPDFPDGPLTGFGIRNTQERIVLLYGEKASVNWKNGENKFIEIIFPV